MALMPFAALATVEMQLVMHCCDVASLLSLAHCGHATLAAASDEFAWQHTPLRCNLSPPALTELISRSSSTSPRDVLQFAPLSVAWTAHALASGQPNAFGLKDMETDAAEWVLDWHGLYSPEPQVDPVGPSTGIARVV